VLPTQKRYRCRFCGVSFAARPVTQAPNGAVRLNHLAARHPGEAGPYLRRVETEKIDTVLLDVYDVVDEA
jgi:hypothetical protein